MNVRCHVGSCLTFCNFGELFILIWVLHNDFLRVWTFAFAEFACLNYSSFLSWTAKGFLCISTHVSFVDHFEDLRRL